MIYVSREKAFTIIEKKVNRSQLIKDLRPLNRRTNSELERLLEEAEPKKDYFILEGG